MEEQFRSVVEQVFSCWSALRIGIEYNLAGPNSKEVAIQFINYTSASCCAENTRNDLTVEDIEDHLYDMMDEHFKLECEDDSPREVATILYKLLRLLIEGKSEEFEIEKSKLPVMSNCWQKPESSVIVSIESDQSTSNVPRNASASSSQEEEPMQEDDGWTVVKSKKKH